MLYYFETAQGHVGQFEADEDICAVEHCLKDKEIMFCYRYLDDEYEYQVVYDVT